MSNVSSIIFLKLLPLLKLLPFYYYDKVFRLIDKSAKSVADIGCGKGLPMEAIKHRLSHKPYTLGIDIFRPYVTVAKKLKIHDEYVICDARFLPLRERAVDVCLCLELIEHLPKNDGVNLIKNLEKIAKRQVLITTSSFEQSAYDNNPFQAHRSAWSTSDFQNLGYKVYGHGFSRAYLSRGIRVSGFKEIVAFIISYILSPITWLRPTLSLTLIASKKLLSDRKK